MEQSAFGSYGCLIIGGFQTQFRQRLVWGGIKIPAVGRLWIRPASSKKQLSDSINSCLISIKMPENILFWYHNLSLWYNSLLEKLSTGSGISFMLGLMSNQVLRFKDNSSNQSECQTSLIKKLREFTEQK